MAGVEIFGATIAALDAAVNIIRAVHEALDDQKELKSKLDAHRKELRAATVIIDTAASEPEVRCNGRIVAAAKEIGISVVAVTKHLETLGGRGRFGEIAHQLARGKREKETLERLVGHLSRRKDDMTTLIGLLNVALARMIRERLDRQAETETRTKTRFTSRIITNNKSSSGGIMFNAPVLRADPAEDHWRDINYLLIDGNTVEDNGVMINYATTLETLRELADDFLAKIRSQPSN